jgi:ABC-type transport system involved in multi-copper enzyme maturation permease subunit
LSEGDIAASTPVTGQSRMDSAWGSGGGDEVVSANVAQATVESGQIFEQIYQPWRGILNPRWMRNWAILRHHLLGVVKKGHRPWGIFIRLALLIILLASCSDVLLILLAGVIGENELYSMFGVNRDNLYGHVLGFFPRNVLYYPVIAALLVGGMISDDRSHGTSALYFSRPISRLDYASMKFLSIAIILFIFINGTLALYYFTEILVMGRGWSWIIDTFPSFLTAFFGGILIAFTYTAIGLALSSVSKGRFFPGIGLIAVIMGTRTLAAIVNGLFDKTILYVISPFDCVAHVTQALMGIEMTYDHPWTWSLASIIVINGLALYVLATRISSLEVTRE